MKAKLIDKKPEIEGVISYIFEPQEPISWKAGQYMRYILDHPSPDDRGTSRFFTISNAPEEKNLRVTTRIAEDKGSSFKSALDQLEVGQSIEALGPMGNFVLDDSEKKAVFLAGGIGITPFRSILVDLDQKNQAINITLLYFNRDENFVFKDEFEQLAKKHPNLKIHYFSGQQDAATFDPQPLIEDFITSVYYISGPEPMVEAYNKRLKELGVSVENIKNDFFPGYSSI